MKTDAGEEAEALAIYMYCIMSLFPFKPMLFLYLVSSNKATMAYVENYKDTHLKAKPFKK